MRVAEVWRYPVKSTQGESVSRSVVTPLGLVWDRQLAIVDVTTGRPLTARREPALLMLSAVVDGSTVRITTPEGRPLRSDGDLSAWFGRTVRLAHPPRDREPEYEFPVDFEDESGAWDVWVGPAGVWHDSTRTRVSILSTASLRDWPVRRFRPNVVVEGPGEDELIGRRVGVGSQSSTLSSVSTVASWLPGRSLAALKGICPCSRRCCGTRTASSALAQSW